MKIIKTTKLKIISHTKSLEPTIKIYNEALSFYIDVVSKEWDNIESLKSNEQLRLLEKLTHKTKKNLNVQYDFDKEFYKFPSYLRRACIMEAIGYYSSFYTNYQKWLKEKEEAILKGKRFFKKPPTLNLGPFTILCHAKVDYNHIITPNSHPTCLRNGSPTEIMLDSN